MRKMYKMCFQTLFSNYLYIKVSFLVPDYYFSDLYFKINFLVPEYYCEIPIVREIRREIEMYPNYSRPSLS